MKNWALLFGSIYGALAVILGAFGAHLLKNHLTPDKLASFETGVKYQMYHAIVLLVLGFALAFDTSLEKNAARMMILGTLLFSFSIYLLAFSDKIAIPTAIIGPITPIGGTLLIAGWIMLVIRAFQKFF